MIGLVEALDEHPGAFAYDWRARFGLSSDVIGESMDWRETWLLTQALMQESDSHVAVAVLGWTATWRPEAFLLADLFDAYMAVHSKSRPEPRERPYPRPKTPMRPIARRPSISQKEVRERLARLGHLPRNDDEGA